MPNSDVRTKTDIGVGLSKVPEVTIFFWIIKVLATTVGETAADFLSDTLNLGLTNTTYIMERGPARQFVRRPLGRHSRHRTARHLL